VLRCAAQAVGGIVGQAELWCALLSICALLLYCDAAASVPGDVEATAQPDGGAGSAASGQNEKRRHSRQGSCNGGGAGGKHGQSRAPAAASKPAPTAAVFGAPLRRLVLSAGEPSLHWAKFGGAVALAWLAALSKEIGITVVGTMALYDLLIPVDLDDSSLAAGAGGPVAGLSEEQRQRARRRLARRRVFRLALLVAVGLFYVKLRSWVAVDQLVRIYRKVGLGGRRAGVEGEGDGRGGGAGGKRAARLPTCDELGAGCALRWRCGALRPWLPGEMVVQGHGGQAHVCALQCGV
jgi:hypothetical protein